MQVLCTDRDKSILDSIAFLTLHFFDIDFHISTKIKLRTLVYPLLYNVVSSRPSLIARAIFPWFSPGRMAQIDISFIDLP